MNHCKFQSNSAVGLHNQSSGGALGAAGNQLKVIVASSSITSKTAQAYGGAIGGT